MDQRWRRPRSEWGLWALVFGVALALALPVTASAHGPTPPAWWWVDLTKPQNFMMSAPEAKFVPEASSQKARCDRGDQPESGLQGQTTYEEIISGRSQYPFYCGTRLVGRTSIGNRGANWQLAWVDSCAYVATLKGNNLSGPITDPLQVRKPAGVAVIDVRKPRKPRPVGLLRSPGAIDAVETMHAIDAGKRKVLVTGNYMGQPTYEGGMNKPWIDIYDVSNCEKPKLKATFEWPENAHNLTLSADGKRVYGTRLGASAGGIMVLDISDPSDPEYLGNFPITRPDGSTFTHRPHEVSLSADQRRIYAASGGATNQSGGVLYILDNSDIVEGRANPKMRLISELPGAGAHSVWPARVNGKPYLVSAPELGPCPGSYPRITDISDETAPRIVSTFRLEMNLPENCNRTPIGAQENSHIGSFASHYNDVDSRYDTKLGVFTFAASGLRIADLRDPENPKEIAYYKPGANPGTNLNNQGVHWSQSTTGLAYYNEQAVDACGSHVRYIPKTGHIWFVCQSNGFHVIELTDAARRRAGLPVGRRGSDPDGDQHWPARDESRGHGR